MRKRQVISYDEMRIEEGISLQRGMNFNVKGKDYGIVLMSARNNAPYEDAVINGGETIIYEGHDLSGQYNPSNKDVKYLDQPMRTPNGKLTENGKFFEAAEDYKCFKIKKIIKVYEKLTTGTRRHLGLYYIADAWTEQSGGRSVFKFKFVSIDE